MEDADAGLFACDRKPKTAEEAPDRWIGDGSHGNEQVGDPPPSTTLEAVLCFQYGEMRHFFGDCPLINSWKSGGSVSWDWDTPCPTKVPVRRRDIAEYHSWRTGPLLGVSFLELYTCWLLKEVSEQKHPGDGYTTEQTAQQSGSDPRMMNLCSRMMSKRKCGGLRVRFESSPSPDLFSNEEHEFQWINCQPQQTGMRLSEELSVDSGSPEVVVMDDNDLIWDC